MKREKKRFLDKNRHSSKKAKINSLRVDSFHLMTGFYIGQSIALIAILNGMLEFREICGFCSLIMHNRFVYER